MHQYSLIVQHHFLIFLNWLNECICINNLFYQLFIASSMKGLRDHITTNYATFNKPYTNQKVVKASDIKLNDVLINGVKLQCFKNIKNKRLLLPRKRPFQSNHFKGLKVDEDAQNQEDTLFKNNAIKRRLRSLQSDPGPTIMPNYQTMQPKKLSNRLKQLHKAPAQILNISTKEKQNELLNNQTQSQCFKFIDVNNRYYNQLKKELMMYSTNNRFNSTTIKNRIQFGKYIGFRANQHKQYIKNQRDYNFIQQNIDKYDKNQNTDRYQSMDTKKSILCNSFDSKELIQTIYKPSISCERQKGPDEQASQKLKICYSTKNQFKRWKELVNLKTRILQTSRSKHSQANPEQKLVSTMAFE